MKKTLAALATSLPLAFGSVSGVLAQEDASKILYPKVQGVEFRIDCARDFPDGRPTLDFLGRLDSHIHGATRMSAPKNASGDNVNLYMAPKREQIIEEITAPLTTVQRAMIRAQMQQLFHEYDAASDKEARMRGVLNDQHGINDTTYFGPIAARCE